MLALRSHKAISNLCVPMVQEIVKSLGTSLFFYFSTSAIPMSNFNGFTINKIFL